MKMKFNLKKYTMSSNTNTVLGLLAGTAVGAIVGILYAPDTGVNTRRKISEKAKEVQNQMAEGASELKEQVLNKVHTKKDTLDTRVEALVSDVSYKTEDIITTLESKLADLKAKNKKLQKSS